MVGRVDLDGSRSIVTTRMNPFCLSFFLFSSPHLSVSDVASSPGSLDFSMLHAEKSREPGDEAISDVHL